MSAILNWVWKSTPLCIVLLALGVLRTPAGQAAVSTLPVNLPYFLALPLVLAAISFNRGKTTLAAANAVLAYAFIQNGMQAPLSEPKVMFLFLGTSLLFFVHTTLLAGAREKGALTFIGIGRLSILILSYLGLWWVSKLGLDDQALRALSQLLGSPPDAPPVTRPALLALIGFCGVVTVLNFALRRTATELAMVVSWLTGALLFLNFTVPQLSKLLFCTLMLSLLIALIQSAYNLAFIDSLTGIPGRRAMEEKLGTLPVRYTLVMVDVDHFKKFNDTHGHETGDHVLRLVASKLRTVSGGGSAYRYGGEEFTLIFPRRSPEEVVPIVNALRESIARYPLHCRNRKRESRQRIGQKLRGLMGRSKAKPVHVTVSAGVAGTHDGANADDILRHADKALYKAKAAGRNCVVAH